MIPSLLALKAAADVDSRRKTTNCFGQRIDSDDPILRCVTPADGSRARRPCGNGSQAYGRTPQRRILTP
jgi:hypothetical protein